MSSATKRILLTETTVRREPLAADKPRIVRDAKIAGFHLWIGKRKKTFRYQYEAPSSGGRRGSTQIEWLGEHPHHNADEIRAKALALQLRRARGEPVRLPETEVAPALTLGQAWALYEQTLVKEGKSPRTIADYQQKFSQHFFEWHDTPLANISRGDVTKAHAQITERARASRKGQKYISGHYAANGSMRLGRAIWNFAKNELETEGLPERNPFRAGKLFHKEHARKTGMGVEELPRWWQQVQALDNPVRRELHLFMLLSGLRRNDVLTARWEQVDKEKNALRVPSPKGGVARAFELPLSRPLLECLERVRQAGQTHFPDQAHTWIFPASGGHVVDVKEDGRLKVSHTGHALRHSFRTLAAAAKIDRLRVKILMNHALRGDVTDSYANVPALFQSLMDAQEAISQFIMGVMTSEAAIQNAECAT